MRKSLCLQTLSSEHTMDFYVPYTLLKFFCRTKIWNTKELALSYLTYTRPWGALGSLLSFSGRQRLYRFHLCNFRNPENAYFTAQKRRWNWYRKLLLCFSYWLSLFLRYSMNFIQLSLKNNHIFLIYYIYIVYFFFHYSGYVQFVCARYQKQRKALTTIRLRTSPRVSMEYS